MKIKFCFFLADNDEARFRAPVELLAAVAGGHLRALGDRDHRQRPVLPGHPGLRDAGLHRGPRGRRHRFPKISTSPEKNLHF